MFNNILGNENIKELLTNAVKNNKTSHSYMFVGTEGIGKKMIAKEFAKMILCTDETKYCDRCKSCIEFESNNNPDFRIIEPDGNIEHLPTYDKINLFSFRNIGAISPQRTFQVNKDAQINIDLLSEKIGKYLYEHDIIGYVTWKNI